MKTTIVAILALAVFLVACQQAPQLAGDTEAAFANYFSNDNRTFNGGAAAFSPGYTYSMPVRSTTEHALWVNCSNVNVTSLFYEVSADESYWVRGAVSLTPCLNNGSKYDLTDKAFNYIRINVTANNGTNASKLPQSNAQLLLAISGK